MPTKTLNQRISIPVPTMSGIVKKKVERLWRQFQDWEPPIPLPIIGFVLAIIGALIVGVHYDCVAERRYNDVLAVWMRHHHGKLIESHGDSSNRTVIVNLPETRELAYLIFYSDRIIFVTIAPVSLLP